MSWRRLRGARILPFAQPRVTSGGIEAILPIFLPNGPITRLWKNGMARTKDLHGFGHSKNKSDNYADYCHNGHDNRHLPTKQLPQYLVPGQMHRGDGSR